jgi:hypothetical protein
MSLSRAANQNYVRNQSKAELDFQLAQTAKAEQEDRAEWERQERLYEEENARFDAAYARNHEEPEYSFYDFGFEEAFIEPEPDLPPEHVWSDHEPYEPFDYDWD